MKKLLVLALSLFMSFYISGQQTTGNFGSSNYQDFFQSVDNYFVRDKSLAELNAKGSPYINESFESARFKRFGNRIYNVRFNAYTNDIEVESEKGIINVNKNQEFEVTFVRSNIVYKNYDLAGNGNSKKTFFVVLDENESYSLLKREKVRFRAEEGAQHGYDKGKAAAFIREKDQFYLKTAEGVKEIPTRKKRFLEAFPEQENELKKFLKNEKLNVGNEADLIKIIAFVMDVENAK